MCVGGEFEVPDLVRVDLAQAEPRPVANQPVIGVHRPHVNGLAEDVPRRIGRGDELLGGPHVSIRSHRVVEQPLLETLCAPARCDLHANAVGLGSAGRLFDRCQQRRVQPGDHGVGRVERRDGLPVGKVSADGVGGGRADRERLIV